MAAHRRSLRQRERGVEQVNSLAILAKDVVVVLGIDDLGVVEHKRHVVLALSSCGQIGDGRARHATFLLGERHLSDIAIDVIHAGHCLHRRCLSDGERGSIGGIPVRRHGAVGGIEDGSAFLGCDRHLGATREVLVATDDRRGGLSHLATKELHNLQLSLDGTSARLVIPSNDVVGGILVGAHLVQEVSYVGKRSEIRETCACIVGSTLSQIAIGVIIDIDLAQQNQVALVVGGQLLDGSRHGDILARGVGLRQIVAVGDTSDILCLQETILVSDVHRHRTIERSALFEREGGAHQVDGLATLANDIVGAVTIDHLCIGELQRSGSHIGSTGHQVVDGVGRTYLATTRLVTTRTFYGDLGEVHGA